MKYFLTIIIAAGCFITLNAQTTTDASLKNIDSMFVKSDTLSAPKDTVRKKTYGVDTVIYANAADSLFFFVNKKKMDLYGKSALRYKETDLKSANIFIDFNTNNIEAVGIPGDSLSGKLKDTPVLKEGGEVYEGTRIKYNYKTTQGLITSASTKFEGSVYTGTKIKKVNSETYFIKDGVYTTCDKIPPDYYFYSPEMKIINKSEIVAKWIWLFFGGVPFPVPLPFAVFPMESGRRSGVLPPTFGEDYTYGPYFSGFGYFWAISNYMDVNLVGDYYTRGSFGVNSRFRYAKRYNFSGNINLGYKYYKEGEITDANASARNEWQFRWGHSQTIDPTTRFNVSLNFVSGKNYLLRTSTNLYDALTQDIRSSANITKTWDESGNSLSLSYSRSQSLTTGNIEEDLPSLSFNKSQSYPFKRKNSIGEQKWYELFYYNYNGLFQNHRSKTSGNLKIHGAVHHKITAGMSPKFGYFNITPSLYYTENWYNKKIEKIYLGQMTGGGDSLQINDVKAISMVRTFSLNLSASTKFYGIFQPNALGISAVRQIVTPSISYQYTPDFSRPGWGYFGTYTNASGQTIKYNKYERELFSSISQQETQSIGFSLGNVFEMKTTVDPTDTTSKEKKIRLININANFNYNFVADSLKFSDIYLSYNTQIGDIFTLNGSSTFSLYDYSPSSDKINKFLINEGKGFLRLTSFRFALSTSISGEKLKSKDAESKANNNQQQGEYELGSSEKNGYKGIYDNSDADFSIPWDISLNYNYSLNKPTPLKQSITSNISASLNFNLTPSWKISVNSSYDLVSKELAAPQIRISKDLHCWLMNFTWNPLGISSGYYFEIRVKAPQLQDLKLTKRDQFYNAK